MAAPPDIDALLADSARSLFARQSDWRMVIQLGAGDWSAALWSVVEAAELPLVAVADAHGGSGGTVTQWAVVLRSAGRHYAPIPLAETGLAGWLLESAGMTVPPGPLTFGQLTAGDGPEMCIRGVPYARHASAVVILTPRDGGSEVAILPRARYTVFESENLAGEPRDTIRFTRYDPGENRGLVADAGPRLCLRYAFVRSIQMAGALDSLLALTLEHARNRIQFGTQIACLPVVRERLVRLSEEVAAADAAAACAAEGLAIGSSLAVGAAKVRIGEAAGAAARLAHQIHGAIGTTREHPLQLITRRLWAWREEAGNERWWSERLGRILIGRGSDHLWPALTETGTPTEGTVPPP
jgi:acyl-CoA dehydrogenase